MAEDLLTPKENGLFLVRESTNYPGDYTLCVCYIGKVEHYRVKYKDNQLTIDDEEFFENLSQLVEVSHFSTYFLNFLTFNISNLYSLQKKCKLIIKTNLNSTKSIYFSIV